MLKTVNCSVLVLPFVLLFMCSLLACAGPDESLSPGVTIEPAGAPPVEIPTGAFSEGESDWVLPEEVSESGEEESVNPESANEQEGATGDASFDGDGDEEEQSPEESASPEEDEFSDSNSGGGTEEETSYDCETGDEQDCTTACGTSGTQTCVKSWGECVPPEEVCNEIDDDCNGLVDDLANGESCEQPCDPNAVGWNPDPDCPMPGKELCADVMSESAYCLTFLPEAGITSGQSTLAYVGLDTGEICEFMPNHSPGAHSIGWVGNWVYFCDAFAGEGQVVGVSLLTGVSVEVDWPCESLTSYQNGLLVLPPFSIDPDSLQFFSTVEDLQAGTYEEYVFDMGTTSRITTNGDQLFTSWHSDHHLKEFSLPTGVPQGPVFLNGHDGWIEGLSITDDGRVAFLTWTSLRVIGGENAAIEKHYPFPTLGQDMLGLECVTNP